MARLPDRDQGGVPHVSRLGLMQKLHGLGGGRDCRRGMERYVTSPMPRDGIFRDAVPSRYVAIR
jgi:hypothetical protein